MHEAAGNLGLLFSGISGGVYELLICASVGIATIVVLVWIRRVVDKAIARLPSSEPWAQLAIQARSFSRLSPAWILATALYFALVVSPAAPPLRERASRLLLTFLLLSLGAAATRLAGSMGRILARQLRAPSGAGRAIAAAAASVVGLVTALMVLDVWDIPTVPMLVVMALLAVLSIVALRDVLPTIAAAMQVKAVNQVRPGDYLKLESGDEGTVEAMTWREVVLRGVDGSRIRVPQATVARAVVANHRPVLRRAAAPLRFVYRSHLRELTGLRARNLRELVAGLRDAHDSCIYYHTHQYLEEHQYLVPAPASAFAEWVGSALNLEALAEELAAINVLEFTQLAAVRDSFIGVLERAIERQDDTRIALPGREFYFIKAVTFATPCPYEASTLSELAGVVRRLSPSSLFYHLFEARLVGGKDAEADISTFLRGQLDEHDLAAAIGRLSPWDYTFEGLRQAVVQRIEAQL